MINDMNIQTLKGFRDFLPNEAKKRAYVLDILKKVFESYGFEPLETPALEYEEILTDKYGDEGEKLMYKFKDLGGRSVALRYDQTVPLARVVAQYANALPMPFKRYQIQPVWRAENTQKGRYREFLQVDADIVGSSSLLADIEIIQIVKQCLEKLLFEDFKIYLNDRGIFGKMSSEKIRQVDKINKIIDDQKMNKAMDKFLANNPGMESIINAEPTTRIKEIISRLSDSKIEFLPTLARGLDYYTGMIFEVEVKKLGGLSIAGGGRYDNLIGVFAGRQIPAVGFAFGFDRLIEAMDELNLFPKDLDNKSVLVTIFRPDLVSKSIEIISLLRKNNVRGELYLDENTSLEKQLKYADKKGIPYAVIIGPSEVKNKTVMLKNLKNKTQKEISIEKLPDEIK